MAEMKTLFVQQPGSKRALELKINNPTGGK
jgi:hypothetical protein